MEGNPKRRALIFGLGAVPILTVSGLKSVLAATGSLAAPPAPSDLANGKTSDARGWAMTATARMPVDQAARNGFMKRKLFTAYTHLAKSKEAREKNVQQVLAKFGTQAQPLLDQPIPGGVGYGLFFDDAYKTAWGAGTAITCDLVCPQSPGGNVDTWLYLTATNRSALGVEAFVSYFGQSEPTFKIFEWALASSNPWQVEIPFSMLAAYLHPSTESSKSPQSLSIWNSTYSLGGNFYRNEVFLYNYQRHGWDLVYQYDYAADEATQKSGWIGSWGPIVETFQSLYSNTKPMGATRTLLTESDGNGKWNAWSKLAPANSYVRNDDVGFSLRYVAPNFSFVAIS